MPFFDEGTSKCDEGLGLVEVEEEPVAWSYEGGASAGADIAIEGGRTRMMKISKAR